MQRLTEMFFRNENTVLSITSECLAKKRLNNPKTSIKPKTNKEKTNLN